MSQLTKATVVAVGLTALLAVSGSVAPGRAHNLGRDSVDGTKLGSPELRWKDFTRYDGPRRYAISHWNRLGRVEILPDTAATIADLKFEDYSRCDVWWEAFWGSRVGADVIGFNPCTVERRARHAPDPHAVAVHEIGHALRLAHPSGTKTNRYWQRNSIMYYCARCTPTSTYHGHDVRDYRSTW